jgi:hypothetical protein
MNRPTGRIVEMGDKVDAWDGQYPDSDPGNARNEAVIRALVQQAHALLAQQRDGFVQEHASAATKDQLRRAMASPIAHLSEVGRSAAKDQPELGSSYRIKPSKSTVLGFQTMVGAMVDTSKAHKDLLVSHGMAAPMLDSLEQMLEQFKAAVTLGRQGRAAHVSATRQLKQVVADIVRTVRKMDGRNRQRFVDNGQALGEWISASTLLGVSRAATAKDPVAPAAEGDVRPAA